MPTHTLPLNLFLPTGFVLAIGALILCRILRKRLFPAAAWSLPDALPAGILLALAFWLIGSRFDAALPLDALQLGVLQVFFTLIGLMVSVKTVLKASRSLLCFYLACIVLMVLQNVLGMSVAELFGIDRRYGILAGSVSMMGGVGTAALFGPYFEWQYGVSGATTLAMGAAALGMVVSLIVGVPFGEWLIRRYGLKHENQKQEASCEDLREFASSLALAGTSNGQVRCPWLSLAAQLGICLLAGYPLTNWLQGFAAFPSFAGTLVLAVLIRNLADISGKQFIHQDSLGEAISVCLVLFIALAILSVRIDTLAALALAFGTILLLQVALVLFYAWWIVFRLFGKNYESMLLGVGLVGFGMGATANALGNMQAVGDRHGHMQKALITVSVTGAFLIDFANAIVIAWMGR